MSATRSRIPAFARWSALPVGLIVSAALVWQASYAAFTAQTTNPTNNWTTGNVALTDDDSNTAMFNATALKGNSTGSRCITVTYNGSLTAAVKLFGTGFTQQNSVGTYIDIQVQEGSGGTNGATECTGFTQSASLYTGTLANFATAHTNSSNGLSSWAPTAAAQSRVFRITYTVNNSITNTQMNSNAQIGLTWEATA